MCAFFASVRACVRACVRAFLSACMRACACIVVAGASVHACAFECARVQCARVEWIALCLGTFPFRADTAGAQLHAATGPWRQHERHLAPSRGMCPMECLHVSRGIWLPQAVHTLRFPSPSPYPSPFPLPLPLPLPFLLPPSAHPLSRAHGSRIPPAGHGIPARQDRPARSQLQRSKEKLIVPLRPLIERACASLVEGSAHAVQVDSSAPAWECSDFATLHGQRCTLIGACDGGFPVPAQLWQRRAQPRCRCGRGGPSPGADVAGVSPVPAQMWQG